MGLIDMTTNKLTFVTVVYEEEYLLLQLQARSMRLYLSPHMVEEIVIIDNSRQVMPQIFKDALFADYGLLAPLVRILVPQDICVVPRTHGWYSQQILKLAVAEHLKCDRYVALDAKNHFIASPAIDFFQSSDGRAQVNVYSFETHSLRQSLENVLKYLGIDPAAWVTQFTATVTPFVLDRAIVQSMIAEIELTSGRAFAEEFLENKLTEFFLYSGYILRSGLRLEDVYNFHQIFCPVIWEYLADINGCQTQISLAEERGTPIFSVHRKALALLHDDSMQALASFWTERRLFDSIPEAYRYILKSRRTIARAARVKRLRGIPHELAALPYRLKRKLLYWMTLLSHKSGIKKA